MDFFSNIIKSTVNKVETFSKTNTNLGSDSKEDNNVDQKVISADSVQQTEDNDKQNLENDVNASQKVRRDSSGDTSGPDDNVESFDATEESKGSEKVTTKEAVQQKAIESAKSFGSFMYSLANKAGQTMTATAKQLKQTVEQSGIMADFTKEQQDFIKEHGGKIETGEPPWVGCEEEEKVKTEVLSLSQDKRNFVRSPPAGVQFAFDMDTAYPIALALLKEDPNLSKMRFEIVPKLVNEESFWRNYFYRVSLIKQSTQLSSFTNKGGNSSWSSSRSSSAEGPDEPVGDEQSPTAAEHEFISDAYQGSQMSEEEVRKGMRQLGVRKDSNKANDDLEEELSKDLQEFEMVTGDIDEAELERELAEMENDVK